MAILGFTGFSDLATTAPTSNAGRFSAYTNFRLGRRPATPPPSISYAVSMFKLTTSTWSKTEYGVGLIASTGTSEDYNVLNIPLGDIITGANVPDGAVFTIGFRARSITAAATMRIFLANTVLPPAGQYTAFTPSPPLASSGTSMYIEVQVKRLTATTVQFTTRVNGGAPTVASNVNQTYNGNLLIGFSGSIGTIAANNGFYITDIYTAWNSNNEDEWLGPLTVGRSTLRTTDLGSLQPGNISATSQNYIKGPTAAVSYAATAATSDNDSVAKTASISEAPWVLVSDPTSPINDASINVLGVLLCTWGLPTDISSGAQITSTIKSPGGTVLDSRAQINNNDGLYLASQATVDMSQHTDVAASDLVFEVKTS